MKVLVSGAGGFIGTYLLKELISREVECVALVRRSLTIHSPFLTTIIQKTEDKISIENSIRIKECSHLIHLSWSGITRYHELDQISNNLFPQFSFLSKIIALGIKNITITGTCLEYGLKEGELSIDDPANPQLPYAIAKNQLRKCLEELQRFVAFDFKWIRLFYIYGEGQSNNTLFGQLSQAIDLGNKEFNMSPGDQSRDYLHVSEVAKYIVDVALHSSHSGIYNCCSGEAITVKDFVLKEIKNRKADMQLNLGFYSYPNYEAKHFWGKKTNIKI